MSKQVYISADYDESAGDREVVKQLKQWSNDNRYSLEFVDMAEVRKGTVANDPDCRICDLKAEFNRQINASSAVIFIVGDKTKTRTAGNTCERYFKIQYDCTCTPYKKNSEGSKSCKVGNRAAVGQIEDFNPVNCLSYLHHEFMQSICKNKPYIIIYNSSRKEEMWLPDYMTKYKEVAVPFWKYENGVRKGNYQLVKDALGF